MAHLTLIRGLPGSGKSTIAKEYQALLLEADMFFVQDGEYKYNPNLIKKAHTWCQNNVRHALKSGIDVVVANTFVKAWELENYAKIARSQKASFCIEEAHGRFDNIHGVPEETIERMKRDWEDIVIENDIVSKR